MNFAQESFGLHIFSNNDGYTYVGETSVYCPYSTIGVEILERTETRLPFVYETILKLVNSGEIKLKNLCEWLGLNEGLFAEILADMAATAKLIDISRNTLVITPKGYSALNALKLTEYKKSQLNNVCINLITGRITSESSVHLVAQPPPRPYMYFDRLLEADLAFLNSHFDEIETIYRNHEFRNPGYSENKLFRLLKIAYKDLRYAPMQARIYVQNETKNILVVFPHSNDFDFASVAYKQIQQETNGSRWLFDLDIENKKSWKRPQWPEKKLRSNLDNAISAYKCMESGAQPELTFLTTYNDDRMLLSGEIDDIIKSISSYSSSEIHIFSSHILRYLTNYSVFESWKGYSGKLLVRIYYTQPVLEKEQEQIQGAISNLKAYFSEDKLIQIESVLVDEQCDQTMILASPGFAIGSSFEYIECNEGRLLLKEVSSISFKFSAMETFRNILAQYTM